MNTYSMFVSRNALLPTSTTFWLSNVGGISTFVMVLSERPFPYDEKEDVPTTFPV